MANHPKLGHESGFVGARHGRSGDIHWSLYVPPDLKTQYVMLAEQQGVTLRALVVDALAFYLDAVPEVQPCAS